MNAQELFDKVAAHLLKQGRPSMREIEGELACAYRGEDGLMCAVGCLIDDAEYSKWMEGKRASVVVCNRGFPLMRLAEHADLLNDLQEIHDHTQPDLWGAKLLYLAVDHGLNFTAPA